MEPRLLDVTANALRHRVLEWDGGGRLSILCLHGYLDSGWAFLEVGPALARAGHHVLAPDLRGHGDTDRVGAGGCYHFADYVLDALEIAGQLGRDRLALCGHSMGGTISACLAGAFPDLVWKAALLEGPVRSLEPAESPPARLARWAEAVRRARARSPRVLPSLDAAAERIRELDPRCPAQTARALAALQTAPVPGGVAFKHDPLHLTPSSSPFQLSRAMEFWRAIRCPVLIVEGAETENPAPPDLEERMAAFGAARRATVAGAGHMLLRHRPEEVAKLLAEFYAEP